MNKEWWSQQTNEFVFFKWKRQWEVIPVKVCTVPTVLQIILPNPCFEGMWIEML